MLPLARKLARTHIIPHAHGLARARSHTHTRARTCPPLIPAHLGTCMWYPLIEMGWNLGMAAAQCAITSPTTRMEGRGG